MADRDVTKVLIAASEFEPFTNIGHLGRVVQNLSTSLNKHGIASGESANSGGYEVRVAIPRYAGIPGQFLNAAKPLIEFDAALGRRVYPCSVYETAYRGVKIYLISCGHYFDREHVYSNVVDDVERYSCFCNAVLAMLTRLDYYPDIIQCHDWQMSYIPTLYKTSRNRRYTDKDMKTLFVIHSMQYQGVCSRYEMLDLLDLPSEFFTPSTLEFYGQANSLKGGLLFSDGLVTVSPNHAHEIQHAYYGENLEGIIRTRSSEISGVICGIDPEVYNPVSDDRIFNKYDVSSAETDKVKNKIRLQEMLGFKQDKDIPVVLVIYDELEYDKGVDLIKFVFDDILAMGVQLVLASKGKSDFHDFFKSRADMDKDRVAYVRYSNVVWDGKKLAAWDETCGGNRGGDEPNGMQNGSQNDAQNGSQGDAPSGAPGGVMNGPSSGVFNGTPDGDDGFAPDTRKSMPETVLYSGCDMLLRPSRIEPCGEKHLIAMKYGALPIVRETGGLKDVVFSYDAETGEGNGFSFFNYNAHDMLYTLNRAVELYRNDREAWNRLMKTAMKVNATWDAAAREYVGIYKELGDTR